MIPTAEWTCIAKHDDLQRSSHVVSVIGHSAYIFGGELVPREPRDNKLFVVKVGTDKSVVSTRETTSAPPARVGSASTVLGSNLYLFSGRGGIAMYPVEEQGGLWKYDTSSSEWSLITPADTSAPFPPARSYHCMCSDGEDRVLVHAGCPEKGRLADLWSFSLKDREWTELASAPPPQRGGASIAFSGGLLYRMNGFDGMTEQGGSLDVYDFSANTWAIKTYAADNVSGPEARSVSALLPVSVGGKHMLLTLFGERDPSSLGHAGAGKMLSDFWLYAIAENKWYKGESSSSPTAPARGWFDADVIEGSKVVVAGGLSETNERLNDVWLLSF